MRIALDPALLNDQPVAAAFGAAAAAGYDAVEICNRPDFVPSFGPVTATADELSAARRAADAATTEIISVAVIQALSSPDENERVRAVAWWADGARAAAELGCRRINSELCGNPNRPGECRTAFLRSIESLLPVLEGADMTVSFEPHPWDFFETTESAIGLIREIGSPRVRYLHCLPHTYYLGGSIADQLKLARGWLDHIHVADTFRPARTIVNPPGLDHRIHQHFDIGRGELDWAEAAAALRAAGFDGIATVQVFGWPERAIDSFRANRAEAARILESEMTERGPAR